MHIHLVVVSDRCEVPDRADCSRIARTCTYFNVRKAGRLLGEVYDAELRPFGIVGTQFSVLVAIALMEGATVGELASAIGADRTTMTRALGPLERDGWIASSRGEDRRERRARLTDGGRRRLPGAMAAWERAQARVVEAMGEDAWAALLAGARRVHAVAGALGAAG